MEDFIYKSTMVFQCMVFLFALYYLVISFFGLKKKCKTLKYIDPKSTFALIVPAHNEEMVIGQIIDSFMKLDYPMELFDIYVVADNCTDSTKEVAKRHGAFVYERLDNEKRGKGFALEWIFNKLFEMNKKYDAVVIFDADNLASKNFLSEMNKKLEEGYSVIQGYLDSKNPHDSWITESYSIAFWTSNRLFQLGRSNLGLSNQIGGTGFCIDMNVLKKLGWSTTCLTEDLEFTCKLILNGYRVGWAHDAVVYDEKPITLGQSWKQRKRWMQGFSDVASRFFFKLMKKAIKENDFVAFDCALYTLQPFIVVGFGIATIITFLQNNTNGLNIFVINYLFNPILWQVFSIFQFLFTPFVMLIERKLSKRMFIFFGIYSLNIAASQIKIGESHSLISFSIVGVMFFMIIGFAVYKIEGGQSLKLFIRYLLYGFYILTWIPITIQGILNKNNKEWCHTKHTRQISIKEIEDMDGESAA